MRGAGGVTHLGGFCQHRLSLLARLHLARNLLCNARGTRRREDVGLREHTGARVVARCLVAVSRDYVARTCCAAASLSSAAFRVASTTASMSFCTRASFSIGLVVRQLSAWTLVWEAFLKEVSARTTTHDTEDSAQ